jgi:hypothetical protein
MLIGRGVAVRDTVVEIVKLPKLRHFVISFLEKKNRLPTRKKKSFVSQNSTLTGGIVLI